MATIISHIYNEQALLPLWLSHHSKYFDNGIIVDFDSNDGSLEIIKGFPQFRVIKSPLKFFDAQKLDALMLEVERQVQGIRMILTATEFLLGNPNSAERDFYIPSVRLINMPFDSPFDWNRQFFEQRFYGVEAPDHHSRILAHDLPEYPWVGRHFPNVDSGGYLIARVSDCFVSQEMFERRLQIQDRIPLEDKVAGFGRQHFKLNGRLEYEDLLATQAINRAEAKYVGESISAAITART